MRIRHNIQSLNANNRLDKNTQKNAKSLERLSSGLRINNASDDAAGLAISEKMRAQIRGLEQANRNVQDAISLIQVAKNGLSEIGDPSLIRLRELAVAASNDTLNSQDRLYIQEEIEQIKKGINDIANNTNFNGINLLNEVVIGETQDNLIVSTGQAAKAILPNWVPTSFPVFAGVNDSFEIGINGINKEVIIPPGMYTHHSFLNELNLEFDKNGIPLTASFKENTRKLQFTSPVGDFNIDSIIGKGAEGYLLPLSVANRTGGVSVAGIPILSPSVTINSGVNDTLTFDVDSITYSITITPGTYTVYGASQSGANENSPFLSEINEQLINARAPVNAQFIYYANSDSPFNNGAGLYLTAIENTDSSSYLSDGTHTFGNFGGNARSTLFDQIANGWNIVDSSTVKTGSVITYPSVMQGEADLSDGLTITTGKNDTLNFSINGIPNSIVLRESIYNSSELINEINHQFNSNNISLKAELNSLNNLYISQTSPFDGDIIDRFSGNAMLDLFYEVVQGEAAIVETVTKPAQGTLSIQVGPNSESNFKLTLADIRIAAIGIDNLTVVSRESAESSINFIDEAIQKVSSERGKFGAFQNRLEHIVQKNAVASENLTSAESRIRDVDYALAA